ncbi:MAG TPA: BatA domain-containing protein [Lacipirellula sp.]
MMLTRLTTVAALEFASPWMLGWLAAAALPWLINLWSRRRHVETSWAAVELLLAAVRQRSRRVRLRELLLLALRTSILLLVALAAARPVWRQSAGANVQDERTHHVIVLDRSFSMATQRDGVSRFARAQAAARQIVSNARAGDAFSIIAWEEAADNLLGRPTFDPASVLAAIDSLEPVGTVARLDAAARAVNAAVSDAKERFPGLERAQVAFVSDLGLNTWSAALQQSNDDPNERVLPTGARIESVDDGVRDNIAITDLRTEPPLPVLDEPLTVVVELQSYGAGGSASASVELLLNGSRVGQRPATFSESGDATVRFDVRLVEPGGHVFEARLDEGVDALAADNRRWLSTEATPGARVLCVADAAGDADDIARALNPRFKEAAAGSAIAADVIATAGLARTDVAGYDAVFLSNVAELLPREQRLLKRYVSEGGALAIVLGDRTKPDEFNSWMQADPRLSPVEIANEPVSGEVRLDPLEYRHPIVQPFAGRSRSGLLGAGVSKYYPLRIAGQDGAAVALAFTSGDPAIVVNEFGRGRVAVMATDPSLSTASEPWSTLALNPAFVPLVRELFAHLTADRRTSQLNYLAGEKVAKLSPAQSRQQGVYELEGESIAVNVDPSESDLTAINASDLERSAAAPEAASATGAVQFRAITPLASQLLFAAAALMVIELTTAWLLGRGWA